MCLKRMFTGSLRILLFISLSSHTSLAQGEFYRYPDNPVLRGGTGGWDNYRIDAPFVLREGGTYLMWYAGCRTYYPAHNRGIGYATSLDGEQWEKYQGNPILQRGTSGSWDEDGISSPSIIRFGNTYFMAYSGTNDFFWRIGLAASPDRVTWTKYSGNPVFTQGEFGEWDSQGVRDPMVIFDGTEFKLYYTGEDVSTTRIGLATSTDGLTWTRAPDNPVLPEGPSGWDSLGVASPFVLFDGLEYYMWYSGYAETDSFNYPHYNIGLATSTDGYQWERVDSLNPVLEYGEQDFDKDAVFDPSVLKVRNRFQIWFAGRKPTTSPWLQWTRIGLARSTPLFLDVTPITTKIPAGEYLDLSVTVRSTSPDTVAFQLWSNAALPNGNPYSGNPVIGPEDLEVGPDGTFTGNFSLYVPYQTPPNSGYKLTTGVGNYPNDIWDYSWFEFEILPPLLTNAFFPGSPLYFQRTAPVSPIPLPDPRR